MPKKIISASNVPLMLLPVLDDSNTTPVPSTSHHDNIPNIKFDEVSDQWPWVANGPLIIGV